MFDQVCDNCDMLEERVFEDTWTGKRLCLSCLMPIGNDITNSPSTDGDNLSRLLREDGRSYVPDRDNNEKED